MFFGQWYGVSRVQQTLQLFIVLNYKLLVVKPIKSRTFSARRRPDFHGNSEKGTAGIGSEISDYRSIRICRGNPANALRNVQISCRAFPSGEQRRFAPFGRIPEFLWTFFQVDADPDSRNKPKVKSISDYLCFHLFN
jgi:hypothetical protein